MSTHTGCFKFFVIFEQPPISQLFVDLFSKLLTKSNKVGLNNNIENHLGKDEPLLAVTEAFKNYEEFEAPSSHV